MGKIACLLRMEPKLQVALDMINKKRALQIATESVQGGADWIEVGTPLIKSEGAQAIRELKKQFPSHTIVADMKVMDTGAYEVEIAAKSGADVICVLGVADNATILDAVKAAKKYNAMVLGDLIGVKEVAKRARELEELGVEYVCIHIGIDEQMKAINPLDLIKEVTTTLSIPIAVAGGINSETAGEAVASGASIIIVGGAITKAESPMEATKAIKKSMQQKIKIHSKLFKKYGSDKIKEAFDQVSTPNISDAMHRRGAMKCIHPIQEGVHMAGPAITVKTMDGDWAKPVEAIEKAKPGDVLVIDTNKGDTAVWGELATWSAKIKKLAGIVIDGAARDIDDIKNIEVPVFSRYQVSCAGEPKGLGEIGGEIICGGQIVQPGDWIVGDDSGVVVIPLKDAVEIANRALDVKEHENRVREEIRRGSSLSSVMEVKKWEQVK